MVKSVIKELIIMLLLIVAIILTLGILLYDYIPNNKIVPTVSEYQTPSAIKEELAVELTNAKEEVIVTYEVDSQDLQTYQKTKDYKAGNPNPFSYYSTGTANAGTTNQQTGNTNNNSNINTKTNNNTSANSSSDGTFYNNKGTK